MDHLRKEARKAALAPLAFLHLGGKRAQSARVLGREATRRNADKERRRASGPSGPLLKERRARPPLVPDVQHLHVCGWVSGGSQPWCPLRKPEGLCSPLDDWCRREDKVPRLCLARALGELRAPPRCNGVSEYQVGGGKWPQVVPCGPVQTSLAGNVQAPLEYAGREE
ncbi:hypothetical protein VTK73DRAFT_592 [Phialemonium thermophilum]|uniref:Uncharacterized protein n=1 Tax=Phialemonium thermophilum TaxID=223376 RepID=A0ABR3VUN3_9PEZI